MIIFLLSVILAGTAISYTRKRAASLRPVLCFDASYGKININSADKEEIKEIPGIGDVIAQRIIDFRAKNGPFMDIEGLRNIRGLNKSRFDRIKGAVCTE